MLPNEHTRTIVMFIIGLIKVNYFKKLDLKWPK